MDIHYKVVKKQGDQWVSAVITTPTWALTYSPEHWTEAVPGSGGIFVFNSLEVAKSFIDNPSPFTYAIWTCECEGRKPRIRRISWSYDTANPEEIKAFWAKPSKRRGICAHVSHGTILYDRIKLLEQVV